MFLIMWSRSRWIAATVAVAAVLVTVVVWRSTRPDSTEPGTPADPDAVAGLERLPAPPAGPSWAPAPVRTAGLTVLASAAAGGLTLHTAHGPVGFLAGVNLGSTTPGHQPGEFSVTAGQYRSWFAAMDRLGVRVVRIYTIHPPAFYTELRRHNERHPDRPLYLMHGVYLPDESYVRTGDLYAAAVTDTFREELTDAVAAAHGELERSPRPGRASGTWTADVSDWLAGWIIGVEWDPSAVQDNDRRNAAALVPAGRYFTTAPGASPTERWLAARMDDLAGAQAGRGRSAPIAFVNWPTTDPLRHPQEPLVGEDLIGVDANRIIVRPAWPGGHFASYHAYPYYPDFLYHETALASYRYQGRPDPYGGYLRTLKAHHAKAGLPVLITEVGVPSSIGSAHRGPLGRDQGEHGEHQTMRIDADLVRLIKAAGLSGALLFSWVDEWFKATWNTVTHVVPAERRQLWHDAMTNEQWFGLLAADPTGWANPDPVRLAGKGTVREATVRVDEGYVHLDIVFTQDVDGPVTVGLDPVANLTGAAAPGSADRDADTAVVLNRVARTGQVWIRRELDPLPLDDPAAPDPGSVNGWRNLRLLTNRGSSPTATGRPRPVEYHETGAVRWGDWDPRSADFDSRAVWHGDQRRLRVRLPWAMAGMADPSSHRALLPAADGHTVDSPRLGLSVTAGGQTATLDPITWKGWNRVGYQIRLKAGAEHVRNALTAVS